MNRVNYNLVLVILVIITWCSTSLTGSIVNEKVNSVDSEFIKNKDATYDCFVAPSVPEDRRTNKSRLTVATFNAEWLFLDGSQCPGSGCPWATRAQAEEHLDRVASAVADINADIIGFQEVQDCDVLAQLVARIPNGRYRHYLVRGTDTATGQNVGILTRVDPIVNLQRTAARYNYPISGSTCNYNTAGDSAVSKHLYTQFKVGSTTIFFVVVHFIAFPTTPDRCAQREAQAMVIKNLINTTAPSNNEVIIVGDYNDYDGVILDKNNDMPTSRVLQFLKSSRTQALNNVGSLVSQTNRYSSWYDMNDNCVVTNNELTTIDHILVSNGLWNKVASGEYAHVFPASCTNFYPDHWPVVITFNV